MDNVASGKMSGPVNSGLVISVTLGRVRTLSLLRLFHPPFIMDASSDGSLDGGRKHDLSYSLKIR